MTNIGLIVTNFGRVPILRIFCAGVKRLRAETGLDIPCVCVGDIGGADVCREYNIQHIEFSNKPLTGKFNRACLELKGKVDYVSLFGSDNIISTETFMRIYAEAEKGIDLIGLSEVYFFCMDGIHTGQLMHFSHTTVLGVARTVSSRVLDQVGWMPWKIPRDRGIDSVMLDGIRNHVKTRILLDGGHIFDLKTSMNLNKVDFWVKRLGFMPSSQLLWDSTGEEETRLIKQYLEADK